MYFDKDLIILKQMSIFNLWCSKQVVKLSFATVSMTPQCYPSYRRFLTPLQQTAFWKHSDKRRNCTKRAQNVQFLLLPQCFPLFVIGYPFNYGDFLLFNKISSKSSAAELPYEGKGYTGIGVGGLEEHQFNLFLSNKTTFDASAADRQHLKTL